VPSFRLFHQDDWGFGRAVDRVQKALQVAVSGGRHALCLQFQFAVEDDRACLGFPFRFMLPIGRVNLYGLRQLVHFVAFRQQDPHRLQQRIGIDKYEMEYAGRTMPWGSNFGRGRSDRVSTFPTLPPERTLVNDFLLYGASGSNGSSIAVTLLQQPT